MLLALGLALLGGQLVEASHLGLELRGRLSGLLGRGLLAGRGRGQRGNVGEGEAPVLSVLGHLLVALVVLLGQRVLLVMASVRGGARGGAGQEGQVSLQRGAGLAAERVVACGQEAQLLGLCLLLGALPLVRRLLVSMGLGVGWGGGLGGGGVVAAVEVQLLLQGGVVDVEAAEDGQLSLEDLDLLLEKVELHGEQHVLLLLLLEVGGEAEDHCLLHLLLSLDLLELRQRRLQLVLQLGQLLVVLLALDLHQLLLQQLLRRGQVLVGLAQLGELLVELLVGALLDVERLLARGQLLDDQLFLLLDQVQLLVVGHLLLLQELLALLVALREALVVPHRPLLYREVLLQSEDLVLALAIGGAEFLKVEQEDLVLPLEVVVVPL